MSTRGYLDITNTLWSRASEAEHNAVLDALNECGVRVVEQQAHPYYPDATRLYIEGAMVVPGHLHLMEVTRHEDGRATARLVPIEASPIRVEVKA